jgi:hypothetical protein
MFKFCMKLGVSWTSFPCLISHEGVGSQAAELQPDSPWPVSIARILLGSSNLGAKISRVKGRHDTECISASHWWREERRGCRLNSSEVVISSFLSFRSLACCRTSHDKESARVLDV